MEACAKKQLDEILSRYDSSRNNLIPILQEVQSSFGYLPEEVMARIAEFFCLPASIVYGVSTFYAQFKFVPMGKTVVKVCRGTACHVRGIAQVLREIENRLGIKSEETTEDLEYSLETVACIGACALAPAIVINKDVHGKMTTKKVREIFGERKDKD